MVIQQLFWKVLLPRFIQNSMQQTSLCNSNNFIQVFVRVRMVQPYNGTHMTTAWSNSQFYPRSDFYMFDNLSITLHALPMDILILLSVDEILLSRHVNKTTNFRGGTISIKTHEFCFMWIYVETNAFCCLFLVMQQRLYGCIMWIYVETNAFCCLFLAMQQRLYGCIWKSGHKIF